MRESQQEESIVGVSVAASGLNINSDHMKLFSLNKSEIWFRCYLADATELVLKLNWLSSRWCSPMLMTFGEKLSCFSFDDILKKFWNEQTNLLIWRNPRNVDNKLCHLLTVLYKSKVRTIKMIEKVAQEKCLNKPSDESSALRMFFIWFQIVINSKTFATWSITKHTRASLRHERKFPPSSIFPTIFIHFHKSSPLECFHRRVERRSKIKISAGY